MRYYYRFDVSSQLGNQFRNFWHLCDKVEAAANRYGEKVGAKCIYTSPDHFAGGVSCVVFDDPDSVNKNIWKNIGEVDGEQVWLPNCEQRSGAIIIPHRGFTPSDTAARIYQKRYSRWNEVRNLYTSVEWAAMAGIEKGESLEETQQRVDAALRQEVFVQYIELYSDVKSEDKRYKTPWFARTAIRLERDRLSLKVVGVGQLYQLVQADLTDNKEKVDTTPTFFEWCNRYYIGIDYPCSHPALMPITEEVYKMKKIELTSHERSLQLLN